MALKPYINFVEESKDGTSFSLQDTTGLTSAGISTGYGGMNPSSSAIQSSLIKIIVAGLDKSVYFKFDSTTSPTATAIADQDVPIIIPFNSNDLGIGSSGSKLPIGVYNVEYFVFFNPGGFGTFTSTAGSKVVTRTAGDFTVDFADANIIKLGEQPYYINKKSGFTALSMELIQPAQASVSSFLVGYNHCNSFAIYKSLDEALTCAIADMANNTCKCNDKTVKNLYTAMMHKTAIDVKISQGSYEEAEQHMKAMACNINRRDLIY